MMKFRTLIVAPFFFVGPVLAAEGYPTADRVQYVLECMKNHEGRYDYLYKCSCAIDEIAKALTFDEYEEASTVTRYSGMGGERMGEFRDSDQMRDLAKKYRSIVSAANKTCKVE